MNMLLCDEGPWGRREGAIEPNALPCQPIEVRRRQSPVSMEARLLVRTVSQTISNTFRPVMRGGEPQHFHPAFRPRSFAEPYQDEAQ